MGLSLEEVALKAVNLALKFGASEAEAYTVSGVQTTINVVRGRVNVARSGKTMALGLRIAVGKRVAVGGGSIRGEADVEALVEKMVKIARVSAEDPWWSGLPERLQASPVSGVYDESVESPDIEGLVRGLLEANSLAKRIDPRLEVVDASVGLSVGERVIANSFGGSVREKATSVYECVEVKALEGGFEASFGDCRRSRGLRELNLEALVEYSSERALRGLRSMEIETGKYTVILMPKVAASIIASLIAPAVSADSVQRGRSPLAGKIGEQILNPKLTIIDDGTVEGHAATSSFDDEGVATRRKTVVEKGVLKSYLYDTYTAKREGKESTGNASRAGVTSNVRPSPTNFIVEPGGGELEDMLGIDRGLIVHGVIGEWLSNPVRGYLNATIVNADYYENGVFKGNVRSAVLAGDIYAILRDSLVATSRKLDNVGGVYAPAILLENVSLAGK